MEINYRLLTMSAYSHFLRDKESSYSSYYNELYNTFRHGTEIVAIIECYNKAMKKVKNKYGII